ncbi:hypothetical protein AB4Z52_07065 [Rhizobium sp. 2YAF20]|uniref:hypothetical protein n=1 Tax=Rhizobium sp. 2YAF20 TaxID=3233027 RepID=UPI003F95C987
MRAVLLLIALLASGSAAYAGDIDTIADFLKAAHNNPQVLDEVIVSGKTWGIANAQLADRKMPMFYCQPERLSITRDQYLQIMDEMVITYPKLGALNWSGWPNLLLTGLERTFPCPKA